MRNFLLRLSYDGYIFAGGCKYPDTVDELMRGYREWRECSWAVIRSAQQDTDRICRMMGAQAARHRRAIASALKGRSEQIASSRKPL